MKAYLVRSLAIASLCFCALPSFAADAKTQARCAEYAKRAVEQFNILTRHGCQKTTICAGRPATKTTTTAVSNCLRSCRSPRRRFATFNYMLAGHSTLMDQRRRHKRAPPKE